MDPIINFIIGLIAAIIGGILTNLLHDRYKNRVVVKRIKSSRDKDIDGFLDLNEKLFPENERSPSENYIRWIDEQKKNLNNILSRFISYFIVAKKSGRVIGLLFFDYYIASKYIFINRIGIDKEIYDARRFASSTLLKKLDEIIRKKLKFCRGIIFEIEAPDTSLSAEQNNRRKARKALYRDYAARRGWQLYEIPIQYVQPKLSMTEEEHQEVKMLLMYIPLKKLESEMISKEEVLYILKAVYIDWYGDCYWSEKQRETMYFNYLHSLLKKYERSLPDKIILKRC